MNFFWKWSMYIMSYVPLYVLICIQHARILIGMWDCRDNFSAFALHHVYGVVTMFVMIVLLSWSAIVYSLIIHARTISNEPIGKYEDAGEGTLNYLATFIVPMISLDISDPSTLVANLILFLILGQLYTMGDLLYLNPVFTLFGYHVIRDTNNKSILFSKLTISELHDYGKSDLNQVQVSILGYTGIKILRKVIENEKTIQE
ncbi:hypothetical protein [Lacticaseibacillus pantheris]|uniref:hypothetical protein n=2 Tax=Lacticaseibacillus pantheris TaxID=171523 RepID=UPI0006D2998D|nr:hypothetical protein [Lacticaseibacillus pantheris]